jgi:hypothetical protein
MAYRLSHSQFPKNLVIIFLLLVSAYAKCQDTTQIEKDTVIIEREDTVLMQSYATRFNPRKALLYAAVVPGLGQVYNKKYWKLPLVYGGIALIGLQINNFDAVYKEYRGYLIYNVSVGNVNNTAIDKSPALTGRTIQNLRSVVDRSRRERDFWVIMMGAMYILQIVDAHVDAHLKEFDLNPNLQVRFQPTFENDAVLGRQAGASIQFRF